ncbi:MAG: hypothetical protein ABS876_06295, partial [Ruminococcus sp.]
QKAALEAMKSRTYIQGGTKLSYAPNERPYHTNYLGAPFEQFMVEEGKLCFPTPTPPWRSTRL